MNLIGFMPSNHFQRRFHKRCKDLNVELIKYNSFNLCNRNEYGMFIADYDGKQFLIHTNNNYKKLLTIYPIDYVDGFKAFIKFFITKPRVLKHDMKYETFGRVFERILSKYNNKLKKYANGILVDQYDNKKKRMCKNVFCQTVYDYRRFYFKYLNHPLTEEKFYNYCESNNIKLDYSIERTKSIKRYVLSKFNNKQVVNFLDN